MNKHSHVTIVALVLQRKLRELMYMENFWGSKTLARSNLNQLEGKILENKLRT